MEVADGAGRPGRQFGCASFNQDSTSSASGTRTGYKLFSSTSVEKSDCIHESANTPDVYIVERSFSSSSVVMVSAAMPQRMNIYHFKKGTEICNYNYPNNILTIKLNRQRLVVFLEDSIYIHNIKDMKLLKTSLNTPSNPSGLCALSTNHSSFYSAYPGSATSGDIIVHDTNSLGTVIRVFSVPDGERLFEFRRGMKRYVSISSLTFSSDGQFLCASSNTETVHIFKSEEVGPSEEDEAATWTAYMGKMFSAASSYLPAPVSGMMSQDRAFATVHLFSSGQRNVCTLVKIQRSSRSSVATADGQLFIYNVDPQDGGECQSAYTHRLISVDDTQSEEPKSEGGRPTQETHSSPSYAETAALPASGHSTATLTGYSEEGGAKKGDVIPEHEFAVGPVCSDDENEFPPIHSCRSGSGHGRGDTS